MVRLQCKTCNHIWMETKKQRESEHVFCSKCGVVHHSHTPPNHTPDPIRCQHREDG